MDEYIRRMMRENRSPREILRAMEEARRGWDPGARAPDPNGQHVDVVMQIGGRRIGMRVRLTNDHRFNDEVLRRAMVDAMEKYRRGEWSNTGGDLRREQENLDVSYESEDVDSNSNSDDDVNPSPSDSARRFGNAFE